MKIVFSDELGQELADVTEAIEEWDYVVNPIIWQLDSQGAPRCDYWIGSTRNGRTWALGVTRITSDGEQDADDEERGAEPPCIVALLFDPPMRVPDPIAEILLRAIRADTQCRPDEAAREAIIGAVRFPVYRLAVQQLPEAPKSWHEIPTEIIVGFTLSEGACVYGGLFAEYARDSLEGVIEVVCGPRLDGVMIGYSLMARGVIPLLPWSVDWPLARRGKEEPARREKVQGTFPWEEEADCSLLTLYQSLPERGFGCAPPYYGEPVIRLKLPGRTPEEAVANWHQCARALRKLRREARRASGGLSLERRADSGKG